MRCCAVVPLHTELSIMGLLMPVKVQSPEIGQLNVVNESTMFSKTCDTSSLSVTSHANGGGHVYLKKVDF